MTKEHFSQHSDSHVQLLKKIALLRKGQGKVLIPTVGEGNLWTYFNRAVGIEPDSEKCPPYCSNTNFFQYPIVYKFQAVAGILPSAEDKYLLYILKCLHHLEDKGELVVVTPSGFTKVQEVSQIVYNAGTITDYIKVGTRVLWRLAKGDVSRWTLYNGQWRKMIATGKKIIFDI